MEYLKYLTCVAIGCAIGWLVRAKFAVRGSSLRVEPAPTPNDSGQPHPTPERQDSEPNVLSTNRVAPDETDSPAGRDAESSPTASEDGESHASTDDVQRDHRRIRELGEKLDDLFDSVAHPRILAAEPEFQAAAKEISTCQVSAKELLGYYVGDSAVIASIALEALGLRTDVSVDDIREPILRSINYPRFPVRHFALRALHRKATSPILSSVLRRLDSDWEDELLVSVLEDFIAARLEDGDSLELGLSSSGLSVSAAEQLRDIALKLRSAYRKPLLDEIKRSRSESLDTEFLSGFGTLSPAFPPRNRGAESPSDLDIIQHDALKRAVDKMRKALTDHENPRSVLMVGDSGVGKSTVTSTLVDKLRDDGFSVFKASSAQVNAGQCYIGQLEERVTTLIQQIAHKRVIWVVENFHELMTTGTHRFNQVGVLHMILPHVESGAVKLVGELLPSGFESVCLAFPRLRGVVETVMLRPPSETTTREIARSWAAKNTTPTSPATISDETLDEAAELVRQYLPTRQAPGNLLDFLKLTWKRKVSELSSQPASQTRTVEIDRDDLVLTVTQVTGLPPELVDEQRSFDLTQLSAEFRRRVLGQPEATDVLVERVAMIKAGLTDPTRPLGVFLFAGPTGTGKTEVAKVFTECLFGSADRMIRLDMSEFTTDSSLGRLIGDSDSAEDRLSLVRQIRQQPFAVVLLDEFEKATAAVWDLFLQVFDDGRLTDRRGNTADCRNAIFILTSNIGASNAHSPAPGFVPPTTTSVEDYRSEEVTNAIGETFRKEFVNRLDRIVVFRPLSRKTMREILKLELDRALTRRGLRHRSWLIDWDESALEFLLERGFSAEFGARTLRRAVEQHLLTPLAMAIVRHEFPAGDHILLVRRQDGGLVVEAMDQGDDAIDASPHPSHGTSMPLDDEEAKGRLKTSGLVLHARGTLDEVRYLRQQYEDLALLLEANTFKSRKQGALDSMSQPSFWEDETRFKTLSLVEYIDRVESSLESTAALLSRLESSTSRMRPDLLRRVAQKIYLLEMAYPEIMAGTPRDAFLRVEPSSTRADGVRDLDFARQLVEMYTRWAKAREMKCNLLDVDPDDQKSSQRTDLFIEGYAAFNILQPESGIHVLEAGPSSSQGGVKSAVRVYVAPQDDHAATNETLQAQARRALTVDEETTAVVRRYRREPTPLVRDRVRGWRTGRLDLVLSGNFDLIDPGT